MFAFRNINRGIATVLLSVLAGMSFVSVLFIDLIPTPFGGYAEQRFFLVFVLGLLVLIAVVQCADQADILLFSSRIVAPTAFLCVGFIVVAFIYRAHSYVWVEPGMFALFFLAPFITGYWVSQKGFDNTFAAALAFICVALCGLYALASVNIYLFALSDGFYAYSEIITWGFVNIRYWSHIATWCLPLMPLAVLVGPFRHNRMLRFWVILTMGLWWWILFLTMSRGSLLSISFGVVLSVLLLGRRTLPWLRVMLLSLALGLLFWLVLSVLVPFFLAEDVQLRGVSLGGSGRWPLFAEAWAMSVEQFPFGMGPQSWLTHEPLTEAYSMVGRLGHPHNMYLLWAAEYGWIVVCLLVVVICQAIIYFFRKRDELKLTGSSEKLLILSAFCASVAGAMFHAGASAVFLAPGSMLVGLFVLAAFWSLVIPKVCLGACVAPRHIVGGTNRRLLLGLLAIGVLMAWLFWVGETLEYFRDMLADLEIYSDVDKRPILPRFWFHGYFPRDS